MNEILWIELSRDGVIENRLVWTNTKYSKFWTFIKEDCFGDKTWNWIIDFSEFSDEFLSQITNYIFLWVIWDKKILLAKNEKNIELVCSRWININNLIRVEKYNILEGFVLADDIIVVSKTIEYKWKYNKEIESILDKNNLKNIEIFNKFFLYIREYLNNLWYEEFNFYNIQWYFQWWNPNGWIKLQENDYFLKLTSELDLKMLLLSWYDKVYSFGHSHRNLESNSKYLREFHELELLQNNISFVEMEKFFFSLIYYIVKKMSDKCPLKCHKLLDCLKYNKIKCVSLEQFKRIVEYDNDYIYSITSLPREISPLNRVINQEKVNSRLYYYDWNIIWNCNEAEIDFEQFEYSLMQQKKQISNEDLRYYMEDIYKKILSIWLEPSCWIWIWIESFVKLILWEKDIRNVNSFVQF